MNTNKHQKAGKKGGIATKNSQPKDYYSMLAKKQWEKRKALLNSITVGEIQNPVTLKSVQEKMEQIDNDHDL